MTIPEHAQSLGDQPTDEGVGVNLPFAGEQENGGQTKGKRAPFFPTPTPEPEPEPEPEKATASVVACSEMNLEPLSEFAFPVVGRQKSKEWTLTIAKLAEYRDSYPDLDVESELRQARQFCRDNPPKRKSPVGMPGFLTRWLNRSTNSAGSNNGGRGRSYDKYASLKS